jgi:hypothetical protein
MNPYDELIHMGLDMLFGPDTRDQDDTFEKEVVGLRTAHIEKQNEDWENWLKPAEWYPAPVVLEARFQSV